MSKVTICEDQDGIFQYELDDEGHYYLHAQLYRWSPYVYKKVKLILNKWMTTMAEQGVLVMFVAIPDNDPKLYKFEKMFGFKEATRKDGMIIMFKETGEL